MSIARYAELLGPLFGAIERKGYSELTAVQRAVLDPALAGRDLRITSQTGSGKTLAIGLILRPVVLEPSGGGSTVLAEPAADPEARRGAARPRALIVAPTRELAHQVEQELRWLYADSGVRLATTTGGASYREEHRSLARQPAVVVGTPGRLLDHLQRGSIDASGVSTVVLDEADRMLDLGFREDLELLLKKVPAERTTHLVSATFPRIVRTLADRVQRDPAHVEGTRLGAANADIEHVIHVVDPAQRLDALINLLLARPEDQTLVFVRTRVDAAEVAGELLVNGFAASALSGEMEQSARNRTLAAFKTGSLRVLIATDVAARGIDAQAVTRVVHGELPTNPDAYTHRAGRTGRAGRKGTSTLLVAPAGVVHAARLLRGLGVPYRIEPVPTAEAIWRAEDERIFSELTQHMAAGPAADTELATPSDVEQAAADEPLHERADETAAALQPAAAGTASPPPEPGADPHARWRPLAAKLLAAGELEETLAKLLASTRRGLTEPREVRVFPQRKQLAPAIGDQTRAAAHKPSAQELRGRRSRGERRDAGGTHGPRTPKHQHAPVHDLSSVSRAHATPHQNTEQDDWAELQPVSRTPAGDGGEAPRARGLTLRRDPEAASDAGQTGPERAVRGRGTARHGRAAAERAQQVSSGPRHERRPERPEARGAEQPAAHDSAAESGFTSFHVSWGSSRGADARRLLAVACKRGKIRGRDVGAIRVEASYSLLEVSNSVAPAFARAAIRPDPREPAIVIRLDRAQPADELAETRAKLHAGPGRRPAPAPAPRAEKRRPKHLATKHRRS